MPKPKLLTAISRLPLKRKLEDEKPKKPKKNEIFIPIHINCKTSKKQFLPYTSESTILVVGDGNFSFSSSLSNLLESAKNIIATCYDSEQVLEEKYADSRNFIANILKMEGKVLYSVDATKLEKYKPLKSKKFSRIVFNFPHTGSGIKDVHRNILSNQQMLSQFFASASQFLDSGSETYKTCMVPLKNRAISPSIIASEVQEDEGDEPIYSKGREQAEIHVTLKTGEPYDNWNIKRLAKESNLICKESFDFIPAKYPSYSHRRTIGFDEDLSQDDLDGKSCKTFVFVLEKQQAKDK